ncbi:hypothetical protein BS47DRAFT_1363848, partial [Hydnum rufescens UP504]
MSSRTTRSTATKLAAGNKRTKTTTSRSSTSTTSKGAKALSKPTNAHVNTCMNGSQRRGLNLTNELEGGSGDGVLPHMYLQRLLRNRDLEEEENRGDTSDVIHRGGRFSIDQIKWAHAKCEEFFAELDAKAKEWNRSPESVRHIALAISPSKTSRNGNAWNAFQALYKKDHPNTDPSVSARDYTHMHSSSNPSEERNPQNGLWKLRWLIAEHESAKVGATKLVAQSGGDIARVMANQKDKWTHDMQWLATMDIHMMFLMVTGNAASPAAHAQNECRLGSEEMAAWYNSNFTMSTQLANIYRFILSRRSRYAELDQFNEEQGKRKHDEDLSTTYKTRTAIKDTLIGLFSPFVKMTKFPWTNLAKVLVQNKLIISNFVPNDEFRTSARHSQILTHHQYSEESSPEKKIVITKVDNWPVGEAEDVASYHGQAWRGDTLAGSSTGLYCLAWCWRDWRRGREQGGETERDG